MEHRRKVKSQGCHGGGTLSTTATRGCSMDGMGGLSVLEPELELGLRPVLERSADDGDEIEVKAAVERPLAKSGALSAERLEDEGLCRRGAGGGAHDDQDLDEDGQDLDKDGDDGDEAGRGFERFGGAEMEGGGAADTSS